MHDNYSSLGIGSRPITAGEEFNMVTDFVNYRKDCFKATAKRKLAVFIETKINEAYPDVVFVEYDPSRYEYWSANRNKLSTNDLKILHFIYSKRMGVTSQGIVKELSIQYKTLLQSLEALIDANMIDRKESVWVIPNKSKLFGVRNIEAVEAKISKWDKVMQQAILNTSFASESFVLSKRKKDPDAEVVKKITALGIGIYLYDSKEFMRYSPAHHNKFPSNYNSIYLNECIGRILNS